MSSFHVRELGNLGLIYAELTPIKTNLTKIYADVSAIKTNSAAMKENTVHKNKSQYIYTANVLLIISIDFANVQLSPYGLTILFKGYYLYKLQLIWTTYYDISLKFL